MRGVKAVAQLVVTFNCERCASTEVVYLGAPGIEYDSGFKVSLPKQERNTRDDSYVLVVLPSGWERHENRKVLCADCIAAWNRTEESFWITAT